MSGRVFKIERTASGERVAYVRLFAGTLQRAAARPGRGRGGGQADLDQGLCADRRAAPRRPHGRGDGHGPWPGHAFASATRSASRRRATAATTRFPRPTLESVVFARQPGRAGLPARGPQPARRAGPAHRRPPGRPSPRDLGVALRRGPEGGHPGDARARLRDRGRLPRDDDPVHRAPGARSARPRRSSTPRRRRTSPGGAPRPARTRSWPRSGSGSSRRRPGPESTSRSTSKRDTCRCTCSRRRTSSRPS